jgi:hypothetical protein
METPVDYSQLLAVLDSVANALSMSAVQLQLLDGRLNVLETIVSELPVNYVPTGLGLSGRF